MSSGSKSSRSSLPADGDGVEEADLLERLVPLEDALLHVGTVLVGTLSSIYQTICFLGGESLALGSDFSSRQRLIMRLAFVSGSGLPKSVAR